MTNSENKTCWIIGAGRMAGFYAAVLKELDVSFAAVCRKAESAEKFAKEAECECISGGLDAALERFGSAPQLAIVAINVEHLADTCRALMAAGTKRILLEKPGATDVAEIEQLAGDVDRAGAEVFVAYNRRYYESVKRLREMAAEDGGVTSFSFEFTEVSDIIAKSAFKPQVKENWLLANSTHVIDTAFLIGGAPERFFAHSNGALDWHSRAARFAGAGETQTGALFSYFADWDAPGRWWIEANTVKHKLILRPMEKLAMQKRGSFSLEPVDLGDNPDDHFKPGIYGQTRAFVTGQDADDLLTMADHAKKCRAVYEQMLTPWNLVEAGA